jgi:hypothetical protein
MRNKTFSCSYSGTLFLYTDMQILCLRFIRAELGSLNKVIFLNLDSGNGCHKRALAESQSHLLYDWRFAANHFVLATSPLRLTKRIFFSN